MSLPEHDAFFVRVSPHNKPIVILPQVNTLRYSFTFGRFSRTITALVSSANLVATIYTYILTISWAFPVFTDIRKSYRIPTRTHNISTTADTRERKEDIMTLPPAYIFGIVGGAIFAFILLCGAIGALQRYSQNRRLESDLEASRSLPEAEARRIVALGGAAPTMPEMAYVRADGWRGRGCVGGEFVEIDPGNANRTASLFERAKSKVRGAQ